MKTIWGHIRRLVLGISAVETTYARRGFRGATGPMQARLDEVGRSFLAGYHAALEHDGPEKFALELETVGEEQRGFAFEGAAMGLALLDGLTPWNRTRTRAFLQGPGADHTYLIHVGVGWVWARWPTRRALSQRHLDPLLCWLAFDGWGFHEGYFHWKEYAAGKSSPECLSFYEHRVFDQGLGRSFWFVNGGNPDLISQMIQNLPPDRRADLWSGVGLSASYAGIVDEPVLRRLRQKAGSFAPQLAQGSAFAARARECAGNLTDYSELAAQVFCEMTATNAARLCDTTLENLPTDAAEPAYLIWRQRIQHHFQPKPTLQEA